LLAVLKGMSAEMLGFPISKVIFRPGFGCASSAGFTDCDGTEADGTGADAPGFGGSSSTEQLLPERSCSSVMMRNEVILVRLVTLTILTPDSLALLLREHVS
jgi:hypothetical protein